MILLTLTSTHHTPLLRTQFNVLVRAVSNYLRCLDGWIILKFTKIDWDSISWYRGLLDNEISGWNLNTVIKLWFCEGNLRLSGALIQYIISRAAIWHGRLARWIKWRACDVGEAKEGLENELWGRWSNGRVGEWAKLARWIKWNASDVGQAKGGLENKLWRRWSNGRVGEAKEGLEDEMWRWWSNGRVGEWAVT